MRRYVKLYRTILKFAIMQALAYPQEFWTWAVVDVVWAVVNIGFFRMLLFVIPEISGWTFEMLAIPLGILYLLNLVIWGFLWDNMRKIPRDINSGDLDMYLVKPVNSQFIVSTRHIGLYLFPSLVAAVFLLSYGFRANNLGVEGLLVIPIAFISATVVSYAVWFMTVTLAFWFNRLLNVASVFPHSVDVARYPVAIFHPFIQFLFTYIIPFAMLGFLPAEVMLGRKSPIVLILPIVLAAVLLWLSHKFWNFSLKRYSSASS